MKFVEAAVVRILGPAALLLFTLATSMNGWADKNKKQVDTTRSTTTTSKKAEFKCTSKPEPDSLCTGSGLRNVKYCYQNGSLVSTTMGKCVRSKTK